MTEIVITTHPNPHPFALATKAEVRRGVVSEHAYRFASIEALDALHAMRRTDSIVEADREGRIIRVIGGYAHRSNVLRDGVPAGTEAFHAGAPRLVPQPTADHKVGGTWLTWATGWYRGWDAANIAAPVDYGEEES